MIHAALLSTPLTSPIIHLLAVPPCRTVDGSTLLLIDSGGQYDCGTTDITRTFHFGSPTSHQKRCYTRVLQGHIKLSQVTRGGVQESVVVLLCCGVLCCAVGMLSLFVLL